MSIARRLALGLILVVLGSMGPSLSPARSAETAGVAGSAESPIALRLRPGGPAIVTRGKLSEARPTAGYRITGAPGQILRWRFSGPAVRFVLSKPGGDTDGPGLPAAIILRERGPYVFGLAADTMAENIYGPFRLTLRLTRIRVRR